MRELGEADGRSDCQGGPYARGIYARGGAGTMQAVILVGGEGTRLRPLTSTVPKPVVPLVDRPFISFMLEWLRQHGIDDVIMSCGFLATSVRNVLGDGSGVGVRLRFVEEPDPRGTAGALKYAESMLDERFLMLNGDVLTDIDLTAQIAQHASTGAKATLALVPVPDPTAYGLVRLAPDNSVSDFVEKPSSDQIEGGAAGRRPASRGGRDTGPQSYTNLISAGAYVLERDILDLVPPDRNVSIEREVWPRLIGNGLYGYASDSYWLDIGTPGRYLQGTFDIIEGNVKTAVQERLGSDYLAVADSDGIEGRVIPPAVIERGVRIAPDAHVGSLVVLGQGVEIGAGSTVERAVVWSGAQIGEGCMLRDCIIAAGCRVGDGTQICGGSVLGEGVTVGSENTIDHGARIFPGVTLPDGALRF
jgi:mannose-1-phosphate guanylyltransferase